MDTAVLISCMALTGTLIIVLLLLCRLVQPHDIAWFLSNRGDKLKLSKMRLYNANGYLMHSGSEILLGSTGSFQRFDSVDRDYKPQYGPRSGISIPSWRTSTEEPDIPPQPLRPAPSPKEAKVLRDKPILRQISEPKAPSSRSILISPIPRPVPRKQHSAPISFPLPLLISPQDKRSNTVRRGQDQSRPPLQQLPCTNPFLSDTPLKEEISEGASGIQQHYQESPLLPLPPPPMSVPLPAESSSSEVRSLRSANNPFIDSPAAAVKCFGQHPQEQQQQQQQQQFCVFNFDPTVVQSLFNRPVPGGKLLLGNAIKASLTTANPDTTSASTTGDIEMGNSTVLPASIPPPPPTVDDDSLRRAHKRISKMENLRKMSRLIESNQVLLNIYQQFNRTISEQTEPPSAVTSNISIPLLPSSSLLDPPVTSGDAAPTTSSADAQGNAQSMPQAATLDAPRAAIDQSKVASCNGISMPSKYRDSPRSDITENIRMPTVSRSIKHILRNRSFSETEFSERKLIKSLAILNESDAPRRTFSPMAPSASPPLLVKNASYKDLSLYQRGCGEMHDGSAGVDGISYGGADMLQKTVSESFLEQYSLARYTEINGGAGEVSLGGRFHASAAERYHKGQNAATVLPSSSCESVASESSVVFSDLVPTLSHPIAGYLCVDLQIGHITDKEKELKVTVQEVKDLVAPLGSVPLDTFVKVLLTPSEGSPQQTQVCKYTERASFLETFSFWIPNQSAVRHSLWFYVYLNSANAQSMLGETELPIVESMQFPFSNWLKLSDSGCRNVGLGELMLSLSYLPTAERLTVVVVKARNLALKRSSPAMVGSNNASDEAAPAEYENAHEPDGGGNVFVKVYLLQNDRKISKKKTSVKRAEQFPIYNEAIIFSLPPYMLNAVQLRLSVVQMVQRVEICSMDGPDTSRRQLSTASGVARKPSVKLVSLGHVIVGSGTTGKGLRHWHHMLTALRKPVTMWHGLRSTSERSRKSLPAHHHDSSNLRGDSVELF